jgi:hypothetical protein
VIHSVARIGVDMPFCSRRTWKTPSGFTTWPTPGCYDDGVVLPRFQASHPERKTTGVYHDNHPDPSGRRCPACTSFIPTKLKPLSHFYPGIHSYRTLRRLVEQAAERAVVPHLLQEHAVIRDLHEYAQIA